MDKKIIENVNNQIEELLNQRKAEEEKINNELSKANIALSNALEAQKQASDEMNAKEYASACRKIEETKNIISMYEMRRDTLNNMEIVPEAESDKVIDSLLKYEDDIAEEYADAMRKHINAINLLYADYNKNVEAAEKTITLWERKIHPNYRSKTTTPGADAIARGIRYPVPVHRTVYDGGALNCVIKSMLGYEAVKILIE